MMHHDRFRSRGLFTDALKKAAVLCFILGNAAIHGQSTAISSVAPPSTIYYLEPLGKKPEVDKTQPPLAPCPSPLVPRLRLSFHGGDEVLS